MPRWVESRLTAGYTCHGADAGACGTTHRNLRTASKCLKKWRRANPNHESERCIYALSGSGSRVLYPLQPGEYRELSEHLHTNTKEKR